MKIDIKMLDESNLSYNWSTIYVGIISDMIEYSQASNYAVKLMCEDNYTNDEFINELSWGTTGKLKQELLLEMGKNLSLNNLIDDSEDWQREERKLRYVLLDNLRKSIKNNKELLQEVEKVYVQFGYPEDMESFISYMPVKPGDPPLRDTYEENINRLKELFLSFLEKEKKRLLLNEEIELHDKCVEFLEYK